MSFCSCLAARSLLKRFGTLCVFGLMLGLGSVQAEEQVTPSAANAASSPSAASATSSAPQAGSWDELTAALQRPQESALTPSDTSKGDPSAALDQLFGPEQFTPTRAPEATPPVLPFVVTADFSDDTVHFKLLLTAGAYIYQDSIVLTSSTTSLLMAQPQLPAALTHHDSLGTHQVYFDELNFDVPIVSAKRGDELILSYQGCDAQGICYPPQRFTLKLPQAVNSSFTKLDDPTARAGASSVYAAHAAQRAEPSFWSLLLQQADGSTISDFLRHNLGVGLLLCFLLGIGLDLTPCVLPMLPIFSAMIVAKPKNGAPVNFGLVLRQNLGYALGLSLCYMVLGLIFAWLGASFHGVLQHPIVTTIIALLLLGCAAACAGLIEFKVPAVITGPLQQRVSALNTKSFGGAAALGVISAIVASPCTSAPLAGALLYVMQSGNIMLGALIFLLIGLGMATPLLLIGIFGGRFLMKGGMVGDLVKRILALLLLFAAYFISRHLMGNTEPLFFSFIVFISSIYLFGSILYFIVKHRLTLVMICAVTLVSLVPTYCAYQAGFEQVKLEAPEPYEGFTKVASLAELRAMTQGQPSFIAFTATWCVNCRYMAHHIYNQAEFLNASSSLKRVVIDITDANNPHTKELIDYFKVMGVPYIVTLDEQGKVHSTHIGLADQDVVLDHVMDLKNATP